MKVIIVIAAYNEEKVIDKVIKSVLTKVDEVVVVDDGSSDQTFGIAKESGAIVLRHFLNRGQGAALQTGINFALSLGADIIVTFDADGQFDPDEIEKIIKPLLLGEFDVSLGSRFLESKSEVPQLKGVILKLAVMVTKIYTGLSITDAHNGFRAISKKAAGLIKIRQDGMAHASEIIEQIRKHNLKFTEVPVTVKYTDYSLKKGQKISNSFKIVWDLILGRITK